MSIIAIESAYDLAIMFGDTKLATIYCEALQNTGVDYASSAKSWVE